MGQEKKSRSATVFGFPISIFFIVVNEFCERFSYYGMRAVLVLYFKYFLRWDDDLSTTIYHTFVALCYLTPILGAIIADSWLGKFKTIVYLSIVYALGQVIMAVSAIHDITDADKDGSPDDLTLHVALSMVGLLLIALGTGGIKPCVAAFGGDQFEEHQEKQRSAFFSIFYLSINAGSLLSTVITPILRAQECGIHTKQSCYPLAFGVPAALMVVALVVFIVGSGMYTKNAPQGNIMVKVCKCIGFALKNQFRHRSAQFPRREHWMDWAEEKYDKLLIAQVKMVLKVLFLYIPLPMFWALFDQQGSRWTLQATTMDGNFGALIIQPDQMQTVNPILILVMVPIMDSVVYPLIAKCKINFTPLRRMTVGMFLAALAFIAAALVQLQIDKTLPVFPSGQLSQIKFINLLDGSVNFTAGDYNYVLKANEATEYVTYEGNFSLDLGPDAVYPVGVKPNARHTLLLVQSGALRSFVQFDDLTSKPEQGNNAMRVFNGLSSSINVTVSDSVFNYTTANNMSQYVPVPRGSADFVFSVEALQCVYSMSLGFGSSYTLVVKPDFAGNCAEDVVAVQDMSANSFHMAWQIPQYFLMTCGEVVFSVTGLEFSYSQAPSNMKSVLQAGWLLTVAVGNIIVLIVAEAATLSEQWTEYLLFACLLILVCVIFAIMSYFYTYIDPAKIEAQFKDEDSDERRKRFEMVRGESAEHKRRGSASSGHDGRVMSQTHM